MTSRIPNPASPSGLPITDMFGQDIVVGSKVIYTSQSEYSLLMYAQVEEIYTVQISSSTLVKLKLRRLNNDGTVETVVKTEFPNRASGDYSTFYKYDTGRPVRATTIEYNSRKFYVV